MKKGIRGSFNGRGPNAAWLLLGLLIAAMTYLFWYNSSDREIVLLSYSDLVAHVEADKVEAIAVSDQHASGYLKDARRFESTIVPNDYFWNVLRQHHVKINIFPQERQSVMAYFFLLLISVIIGLAFMYLRQGQGGGGGAGKIFNVGKSKARFFSPNSINVTFKDVAGVVEAKEDLKDVVEFLKYPDKFGRLGAKIPRGILLSGAPGNGKTMLAKAVAGEASCPFFSISGSDFVEVFVGVGASRVRDLFVQARKNSPCIVFIDEIDAVGRQRGVGIGGGNDEREQTLNQLLSEMDGFSTEAGAVIVLAATNRPDVLDKALLRPGRFDRIIEVPYPDLASREQILGVHVRNVKLDPMVDLKRIARGTPGFSGADLGNLINEAALAASKANKEMVEVGDFEAARDKLLLGSARTTMVISEKEKRRTSYHESGHTLLNLLLLETDPFHKVTIIPRGRALGVSWSLPENDRHSETKGQMLARIMVCLGGMLAEKHVFDELTSGASNDLEKATHIAKLMVCKFGMSALGPIVFGMNDEHPYLGRGVEHTADYSENTARKIDEEVEKIIRTSWDQAEKLLLDNRAKLDLLANTLLEKETLQAAEVYELLGMEPRELHSFNPNNLTEGGENKA